LWSKSAQKKTCHSLFNLWWCMCGPTGLALQYWNLPLYFGPASADSMGTIVLRAALISWLLSHKVHSCSWHNRDILCFYIISPILLSQLILPPPPSYDCMHVSSVSPCSILDLQNYVSVNS
jgi:hypothetical protein